MPLDKNLMELLCCPACHGDLDEKPASLLCRACGRRYPIRDEIPIMLVDEAFYACPSCGSEKARFEGTVLLCPACGAKDPLRSR